MIFLAKNAKKSFYIIMKERRFLAKSAKGIVKLLSRSVFRLMSSVIYRKTLF
ncbi:hypothetical protein ES703_26005 [subsurface metagenome]